MQSRLVAYTDWARDTDALSLSTTNTAYLTSNAQTKPADQGTPLFRRTSRQEWKRRHAEAGKTIGEHSLGLLRRKSENRRANLDSTIGAAEHEAVDALRDESKPFADLKRDRPVGPKLRERPVEQPAPGAEADDPREQRPETARKFSEGEGGGGDPDLRHEVSGHGERQKGPLDSAFAVLRDRHAATALPVRRPNGDYLGIGGVDRPLLATAPLWGQERPQA